MSSLYLGIDGGASGTRAILIDGQANILGTGSGGNANHAGQGYAQAVAHVMEAVRGALRPAHVTMDAIETSYFALAGDDVQDDHVQLVTLLSGAAGHTRFAVSNDVWAGLRAGSVSGVGIAVNCGSGTGAVGKAVHGGAVIIPDLGYVFGDSGGGTQIGLDAFRAVIRAWDGRGEPTVLTGMLLELTTLPSTEALYLALYRDQITRGVIRKATRLVFQAAAQRDAVAVAILRRIGDEMGTAACAIARRLQMESADFPFILTGGAVRTLHSPLAEAAIDRLRMVAPGCTPTLPLLMPVAGAALLALDMAGVPVTADHFAHLRSQGQAWHAQETFSE